MKRFILVAATAVFTACSSSPRISSDYSPGDAENAIRRANADFAANARAGNAQTLINNFYAPDATVMAPNMPVLRGRDSIQQFWTGFLASGSVDLALTSTNVTQPSGDVAVEAGRYDLSLRPASGQAIKDAGKYMVLWKKSDGRWWAVEDIFNSDMPK
ncbi:MAG: SgcJ/EcaC family oxidoreductase [Thermoanaerobaculia bacterium]